MKGMVFTEFLDFVENQMGMEMVDKIVTEANLESGGCYTKAGYYPHQELIEMLIVLSKETETPIPDLVRTFGTYLFGQLIKLKPEFVANSANLFDFLDSVENIIHVDVKRVYPDAELPKLQSRRDGPDSYVLIYASNRHFADLAEGMLLGSIKHYREDINMKRQDISSAGQTVQMVQFTLTKSI